MPEIILCPRCGAPNQFVSNHLWLSGGVIVQSGDREHRMVLVECDNLDPLFKEIEEIIGVSIGHIVIETKRRSSRDYLDSILTDEIREQVRSKQIPIASLVEGVNAIGYELGYGDSRLVDVRYEDDDGDYVIERIREPYSVPLWCGDLAGSAEAVTSRDHEVVYRVLSSDLVEIRAWPSPRPEELRSRLQHKSYAYSDGDMELERCPECGGPAALSDYKWDTARGVIEVAPARRRVVMFGPAYLEAVFEELERELGEEIPRVVAEAQRRFSRKGPFPVTRFAEEERFRLLLAVRGLGNLREMALGANGLTARIGNAVLPLMMAGMMQGYYETVSGKDSDVDWELGEDGTLDIAVTPKA